MLARGVAEVLAQLGRHREGDGHRVVGEPFDRATRSGWNIYNSLKWSNGSRQATQRRSALQAVEENRLSSSVSVEPQCGQRTEQASSGTGPPAGRVAGRGRGYAELGELAAALRR